jgi:hypothetical protein
MRLNIEKTGVRRDEPVVWQQRGHGRDGAQGGRRSPTAPGVLCLVAAVVHGLQLGDDVCGHHGTSLRRGGPVPGEQLQVVLGEPAGTPISSRRWARTMWWTSMPMMRFQCPKKSITDSCLIIGFVDACNYLAKVHPTISRYEHSKAWSPWRLRPWRHVKLGGIHHS